MEAARQTDYLKTVTAFLQQHEWQSYEHIYQELERVIRERGTLFLLGSGLSASVSDHFSNDLSKSFGSRMLERRGFGIQVVSATESMSTLTALANDNGQGNMYADFIQLKAKPHDLALIFCTGQPRENVLLAAKRSQELGIRAIAVTGSEGSALEPYCSTVMKLPLGSPQMLEDAQLFLCHSWTLQLIRQYRQPTVFLDRDGVINEDHPNYVKNVSEFKFAEGIFEAIAELNRQGFAIVVITNQACIQKGLTKQDDVDQIHRYLRQEVERNGGRIGSVYVCPHTPEQQCQCRKPKNGLIERAIDELGLDRERSYFIGDRITDIQAGCRSDLKTILLDKSGSGAAGQPGSADANEAQASFRAASLAEAVRYIIHNKRENSF